jgi:hypothetical protein
MLAPGETFATGRGVQCFVSGADADQAPNPAAPGTPGGLPDDRTPLAETPFTPESAQGAANVVQTYYALIADRDYSQAWRLWGDEGKASGQQEAAFARSFDQYTSYNANVGAPGRIEGAAGSRYVEVPVQVYGQLKSGEAVNLIGTVGLKRTAEVSGSTPEQRAWRIAAAELKPAPAN